MSDKINVEDILQKYTLLQTQFSANPILEDNTKEAIKEIVEAVFQQGLDAGLALSTMTKEPFTSPTFKILKEALKPQVNYDTT